MSLLSVINKVQNRVLALKSDLMRHIWSTCKTAFANSFNHKNVIIYWTWISGLFKNNKSTKVLHYSNFTPVKGVLSAHRFVHNSAFNCGKTTLTCSFSWVIVLLNTQSSVSLFINSHSEMANRAGSFLSRCFTHNASAEVHLTASSP